MLLSWLCLLSLIVSLNCDQCIRYEFHENAINQEGNAELLINDCRTKNSKITDYNAMILQIYGPPMINITFNCCSSLPCKTDLQCPFNFNCNRNKCLVADDCNLRDEMEIVGEENQECIIDEDCYFKIPLDKKHWSCLSETTECVHKENCLKKCKRCAFVGDHWSNFVNNTIDAGLYNNESPNTSLIDDLLPTLRNNTITTSTPPSNNLVEFSLNSLINESGNDNNDEIVRSEEGVSRLLDINRNVNNNINTSTTTVKPSTINDLIPPVNSTNRILSPNNITSLLEFINNNSGNRLNNNLNSRSNTRVTNTVRSSPKPDSSGFTSNDLPTNILNEISSTRNVEPSSSTTTSTTTTSTTTTSTTTTSTTTTTTPSPISSSSEETSNESSEFNSNRINHTIDDFLFTRTNNEENSAINNTNDNSNDNIIDLFSSIINNYTSHNRSPPVDSVSIPLANSTLNRLNNDIIRTSDPFNSPFGNLFNLPLTTSTTVPSLLNVSTISIDNSTTPSSTINTSSSTPTTTTTTTTTTTPKPLSTSAVLSAASILNRSRSAIRNTDNNNRFARRSSSLRTNPARSILNNHRLIHLPNNNNRINNNNRRTTSTTTTSTTTSTTTNRPPIINNNPYYHLASILNNNNNNNHNSFNEMLPGILYAIDADIDIPRLNSTSVH